MHLAKSRRIHASKSFEQLIKIGEAPKVVCRLLFDRLVDSLDYCHPELQKEQGIPFKFPNLPKHALVFIYISIPHHPREHVPTANFF
jgi:hypothetical protein